MQQSRICILVVLQEKAQVIKADFELVPVRTQFIISKKWAQKVRGRIGYVKDLYAADAVYHQACSANFRTIKQIPQKYIPSQLRSSKQAKVGRPADEVQAEAFLKVMAYLEANDEEQTTIHDLIKMMGHLNLEDTDVEPYGFTHIKQLQLLNQFGDRIVITEVNCKLNFVTFWNTAQNIINQFHSSQSNSQSCEEQKTQIIQAATMLIKHDMKSIKQDREFYPQCNDMESAQQANSFIPESLRTFLKSLFVGVGT